MIILFASEKLYKIKNYYNSLRAINLPYCPNRHLLEKSEKAIQFEKIPSNLKIFNIIEIKSNGEKKKIRN